MSIAHGIKMIGNEISFISQVDLKTYHTQKTLCPKQFHIGLSPTPTPSEWTVYTVVQAIVQITVT